MAMLEVLDGGGVGRPPDGEEVVLVGGGGGGTTPDVDELFGGGGLTVHRVLLHSVTVLVWVLVTVVSGQSSVSDAVLVVEDVLVVVVVSSGHSSSDEVVVEVEVVLVLLLLLLVVEVVDDVLQPVALTTTQFVSHMPRPAHPCLQGNAVYAVAGAPFGQSQPTVTVLYARHAGRGQVVQTSVVDVTVGQAVAVGFGGGVTVVPWLPVAVAGPILCRWVSGAEVWGLDAPGLCLTYTAAATASKSADVCMLRVLTSDRFRREQKIGGMSRYNTAARNDGGVCPP